MAQLEDALPGDFVFQSDFGSSWHWGGCEHMRVIEKQVLIFFVGIISLERDKKRLERLAVQKLRVM